MLCNDVSARDLMFGAPMLQWFQGKSQRTFCPTGPVLYLLDEPETALSPKSQLELLELLHTVSQRGHAQFIVASHSPILLACPEARILDFNRMPLGNIDYEDTEYFRIYRDFLNNRNKYLS